MAKDDEMYKLLMDIHEKVHSTDKAVAVQATETKNIKKEIVEIKDEQKRQNVIVEKHERRSIASEGRLSHVEDQNEILMTEHKDFRNRIKVAEKPGLVLTNIWRALITLGAGAAAMLGILKFLDYLKLP